MAANSLFSFRTASAVLVSTCCVAPCWAAGPWLSETGGADMGMAGAGRAALSLDAASLSSNPAAMGRLPGSSIAAAVMPLALDYEFRGSDETPASAANEEGITTIPALYAVRRAGSVTYGLGAYSYLGLSFDSGNQWAGRRVVERAGIATFNIAPAIAWAPSDRLTVGASIAAQLAQPEIRLAVANDAMFYGPPVGMPDGQLKFSGDSWAAGGQLGVLYEPVDGTRIGLAWTAPVSHSAPLDIEAQDLHPVLATLLPPDGTAKLDFTLPQQLMLGLAHRTDDGTLLTAGLTWQDWSALGDAEVRLPGQRSPVFPNGLRDTWGCSLGVRRAFGDRWSASAGVGYESSPAPDSGVPAYFPVAEQWRVATGVERQISDSLRLRTELSATFQGDANVVQTTHPLPLPGIPQLTGTYEDTRVYMIALAADFTWPAAAGTQGAP